MNPEQAGGDNQEWTPAANPVMIALAVVLAAFIEVLDTTIISVAQPYVAGSLAATNEEATWVLTSYLVANAIILPASGWLAIRFGRKRFLMACTAIFIAASFLCGIAPSMGFLVAARVLQGLGGGALQPIAQAVLIESFPGKKRGMAMAAFGFAVVFAPVLGPTLGGWLTDHYSWRWVFNINIPIGLFALWMMGKYLEDPPYIKHAKVGAIDSIGFGLLALWLATLQIVLDKGQSSDWFATPWIRWFALVSAASLIALVVREMKAREPIVDLRAFLDRNFWVGTSIIALVSASMYGSLTVLPLFLQNLMGYTSEGAGWATAPRGIGAMIGMPLVGILMSRVDGRWLTVSGIGMFGLSTFWISRLSLEAGMSNIAWPNVLQGLGMGFIFVPVMSLAMATLPNSKIGNASGIFNLARNLGGSVGIAISTTFITRFAQTFQSQLVGKLTPMDPVFQEHLGAATAKLTPLVGAPQAAQQAKGLIYGAVLQQANYQAFMAVFAWSALFITLLILTPLLMKKVTASTEIHLH